VVHVCVELALLSSISTSDNLVRKIATVSQAMLCNLRVSQHVVPAFSSPVCRQRNRWWLLLWFGGNDKLNMSTLFELRLIAISVSQRIFNVEISIQVHRNLHLSLWFRRSERTLSTVPIMAALA
jgi:hypothetical protein